MLVQKRINEYETIFNSITVGVVMINEDGTIANANNSFAELLNIDIPSCLIGFSIFNFILKKDVIFFEQTLKYIEIDKPKKIFLSLLTSDNQEIAVYLDINKRIYAKQSNFIITVEISPKKHL